MVSGSGSTSGLLGAPLDDAAEAEAEREREVPRGVPGGIDRAREPEPRKAARRRRAGVLKRREHRPGGVEAQAEAHRRAEQPAAGRALQADEAAVDEPQAQPETAARPGVAIALGRQREARRTLVVLGGGGARRSRRRGQRRGRGRRVRGRVAGGSRPPQTPASTPRARATAPRPAAIVRAWRGRGGSRPAWPPRGRAGREVPIGDRTVHVFAAAAQRVVRQSLAALEAAPRDDELDEIRGRASGAGVERRQVRACHDAARRDRARWPGARGSGRCCRPCARRTRPPDLRAARARRSRSWRRRGAPPHRSTDPPAAAPRPGRPPERPPPRSRPRPARRSRAAAARSRRADRTRSRHRTPPRGRRRADRARSSSRSSRHR